MSKYFEREAVIEFIRSYRHSADIAFHMEEHLNEIPAADVRPVRHGRWGVKNECSECGCQPWFERDIHTINFCPKCGADMREES